MADDTRKQRLLNELKSAPAKGIEKCRCGKTFWWVDPAERDEWVREHEHARPTRPTRRNFDPEYRIDMYQARCTNCGYVETEYGDYSGFGDLQDCIDTLEDTWFARYRYEPAPRPDCPGAKIAHIEELLCPTCWALQQCDESGHVPALDARGEYCDRCEEVLTPGTASHC